MQQSEKSLAGIPVFVCEFLHVSQAVPCPPFLHTSESGQRTTEQDNSVVSPPESSTKSSDTALTGPGHNGVNDRQDAETERCEQWENLCSLYCTYRKSTLWGTGTSVSILSCEAVKKKKCCQSMFPSPGFTHSYKLNDAVAINNQGNKTYHMLHWMVCILIHILP